eukprot:Sdes_comp22428_c0_seq1m20886
MATDEDILEAERQLQMYMQKLQKFDSDLSLHELNSSNEDISQAEVKQKAPSLKKEAPSYEKTPPEVHAGGYRREEAYSKPTTPKHKFVNVNPIQAEAQQRVAAANAMAAAKNAPLNLKNSPQEPRNESVLKNFASTDLKLRE